MLNKIFDYLGSFVVWAFLGFGVAFIIVMAISIITNSGNGPLAIFIYGPLGFIIGGVIGIFKQVRKSKNNLINT